MSHDPPDPFDHVWTFGEFYPPERRFPLNDPSSVHGTLAAPAATHPALDPAPRADTPTGTDRAPDRYTRADGRETIDVIRAELGDAGFVAWCRGNVRKYLDRSYRRGTSAAACALAQEDLAKATFYAAMTEHVEAGGPDPRSYRTTPSAPSRATDRGTLEVDRRVEPWNRDRRVYRERIHGFEDIAAITSPGDGSEHFWTAYVPRVSRGAKFGTAPTEEAARAAADAALVELLVPRG